MMRPRSALVSASLVTVALLGTQAVPTAGAAAREETAPATAASTDSAQVRRGEYLVTIGGCNDCHTPWREGENGPEPDMSRMLSGHPQDIAISSVPEVPGGADGPWMGAMAKTFTAWAGPWGVSFTRNLTPDVDTGLGGWTEQEFVATLRAGRQRGIGRELLPPMPWENYGQATDEDLAAIFAYLRSIPAISNRVPDPLPPSPPADPAP